MPKKRSVAPKAGDQKMLRRMAKQQTLLRRAVENWPQFDGDEPVNGGDLVEWFAAFRADAKRLMN
jgi:hypothetical protein